MAMPEFRLAGTIFVALLAALTVACGAASTATPSPASAVPTGNTGLASPTATLEPATAAPTPTSVPVPTVAPTKTTPITSPVFIQLTDPLDEPQFYCLDVPGAVFASLRKGLQRSQGR